MKILIVDDEHDVEFLFRQRFRKEMRAGQFGLVFATSGQEALDFLQNHPKAEVLLVLSDINMPGMTGLELLKEIKSDPPPVPVCMMTAYGNDSYRQKAAEYGSDGYMTKPIDFASLKERIRELAEA